MSGPRRAAKSAPWPSTVRTPGTLTAACVLRTTRTPVNSQCAPRCQRSQTVRRPRRGRRRWDAEPLQLPGVLFLMAIGVPANATTALANPLDDTPAFAYCHVRITADLGQRRPV